MSAQELLQEISDYCRHSGLAESTFGRRAVNDGKLTRGCATAAASPPRRSTASAPSWRSTGRRRSRVPTVIEREPRRAGRRAPPAAPAPAPATGERDPQRNFRFFDNRQKYLLFVNTCSEKWVVASRVGLELANVHPRPPAMRVFDAGVGDGTVLLRVMRAMHDRFPHTPFYVVGKEISLEDVRLALQKMSDRFFEHPATVLVLTNLAYADAPWLAVKSLSAASSLVWHEVPLAGNSAYRFEQQITDLEPFLAQNWKAGVSPKTGNPVYDRPVVMVIYREDHKFLLDPIIPRPGGTVANYDLVMASQPYRARASLDFKAKRVIAPLAKSLGPGGRLIAIHSHGNDPGMEIIRKVWPGDNPFLHDRHQIMKAVKHELGHRRPRPQLQRLRRQPLAVPLRHAHAADPRSSESSSIGTSTLFAAWNAAIYVAQVEDDRLGDVVADGRYLDATREVLREHGGALVLRRVLRDLAPARVTRPASSDRSASERVTNDATLCTRRRSVAARSGRGDRGSSRAASRSRRRSRRPTTSPHWPTSPPPAPASM